MPYKVQKLPDGKYKITNKRTGRVIAYHTTKKNAEAQLRLLHYVNAQKGEKYMKGGVYEQLLSEYQLEDFINSTQDYSLAIKLGYLINLELPSIKNILEKSPHDNNAKEIGEKFVQMKLKMSDIKVLYGYMQKYVIYNLNLNLISYLQKLKIHIIKN